MRAAWAVSWLGFGLVGGIVLKTALDELERRAGYTPAPLAAPSIKVTGADLTQMIRQHERRNGRGSA